MGEEAKKAKFSKKLPITKFWNLMKGQNFAEIWPKHFICGKLFQKGQIRLIWPFKKAILFFKYLICSLY
jgi:hypothetical protein